MASVIELDKMSVEVRRVFTDLPREGAPVSVRLHGKELATLLPRSLRAKCHARKEFAAMLRAAAAKAPRLPEAQVVADALTAVHETQKRHS